MPHSNVIQPFTQVSVVDLSTPAADAAVRVPGVTYHAVDLCTGDLTAVLRGVHAVCPTAGRVCLADNPGAVCVCDRDRESRVE